MRPTGTSRPPAPRRGFTLFEVAISLALVAFGVVSVLMLLPSGIKAQQLARFQVLASARAMEMIDQFSSSSNTNLKMEREGVNPWDSYASYRAYAPDLEARIGTYRFGLFPLPTTIARRLDSDGDEVKEILDEGGYLYYTQPMATTGFNPVGLRDQMPLPNESQKLLCAVVGYAQQNAITFNSWKDWPYHASYPSPPMHGIHKFGGTPSKGFSDGDGIHNAPYVTYERQWTTGGEWFLNWEDSLPADNGDMGIVYRGIIRNAVALPLTTAWVDDPEVEKVTAHGRPLHKCSGYFAYGDLGGWILDRQVDKDPDGNPTFPGYWRQVNPDGLKRLNNRENENTGQPEFLPGTTTPNPVYQHADGTPTTMVQLSRESALAYFGLAYWYAKRKGVSDDIQNGVALLDDAGLLTRTRLFQGSASHNPALAVNAARFLAHAAMCVTAHFAKKDAAGNPQPPDLNGQPEPDETITLGGEFQVLDPKTKNILTPGFTIPVTFDRARAHTYYENAMKLVMRYAASHPYDFGAPRPLNRSIMMDFPLIQYDPFGGLVQADTSGFPGYNYGTIPSGSAAGNAGAVSGANQWRMISAQPITNLGRSFSYPAIDLAAKRDDITSKGSGSHFTLTRRFEAPDRCRQLVFFAVDWQAYEDFETAPSAAVDASRYPRLAPHNRTSQLTSLLGGEFADRFAYGMRNPEKTIVYVENTVGKETGADVHIGGVDNMWEMNKWPDFKTAGREVFSGRFGADRNFNGTKNDTKSDSTGMTVVKMYGRLDRGPLPASTRMRAVTIARFNFYDPRIPLVNR